MRKIPGRIKKWDHLAVRPETFTEFRELRPDILRKDGTRKTNNTSDNAFVRELIRVYKLYLQMKKKKEEQNNEDKKHNTYIISSVNPILSMPIGVTA